jgi:hypothetical protein
MYKYYNIIIETDTNTFTSYYKVGLESISQRKKFIEQDLTTFLNKNRSINGSAIQKQWFPTLKADVFLSHSHEDEFLAYSLAGFLKKEFDLNVFIDSALWGYMPDLFKLMSIQFPKIEKEILSSHVHIMLTTALSKIMDTTECIFFLNTTNSIKSQVQDTYTVNSQWLYHELSMLSVLKENVPLRIPERRTFSALNSINEHFEYYIDLSKIPKLSEIKLRLWKIQYKLKLLNESMNPLDVLYKDY